MKIVTGNVQRRNGSERQADHCRDQQTEEQHGAVEPNVIQTRNTGWTQRYQGADPKLSDEHAQDSAKGGKQQAFGQQLTGEPRTTRAERGAHGKLSSPLRS